MVLKEFIDINTHKFEEETIKSTDVVFWGWHVKEDFFGAKNLAKRGIGGFFGGRSISRCPQLSMHFITFIIQRLKTVFSWSE